MKPSRSYALGLLAFSIAGMLGLSVWNFTQTRGAIFREHERWAQKMSEQILAERVSSSAWMGELHDKTPGELKRELFFRADFCGSLLVRCEEP